MAKIFAVPWQSTSIYITRWKKRQWILDFPWYLHSERDENMRLATMAPQIQLGKQCYTTPQVRQAKKNNRGFQYENVFNLHSLVLILRKWMDPPQMSMENGIQTMVSVKLEQAKIRACNEVNRVTWRIESAVLIWICDIFAKSDYVDIRMHLFESTFSKFQRWN